MIFCIFSYSCPFNGNDTDLTALLMSKGYALNVHDSKTLTTMTYAYRISESDMPEVRIFAPLFDNTRVIIR